ncbi:threonine-phosphate decarboxylase CobD [Desulfurivibrio sp. D14AmB]|uniref:threonine-phosphate decarboxylase CobD n=1 Tax=Desulfurivibrio sp. D14AmB TaxID=3374370 RepID=UPI00376ED97C
MKSASFAHGGNLNMLAAAAGVEPQAMLDFSASINPLGMPAAAREAIIAGIAQLGHYPDPLAEELVAALAESHRINPELLLAGNGSTELLYLALRVLKPGKVLLTAPGFSEYERAARLVGGKIKWLRLKRQDDFRIDPAAFTAAMAGCDLALLCNPNNPTGQALSREETSVIATAAKACRCRLLLDEAFADFCPEISLLGHLHHSHLLILRSLTKFYALPGLRLGFLLLPRQLRSRFLAHKEPWSVNTLAIRAAVAALADRRFAEQSRELIAGERPWLAARLSRLVAKVYPAAANYLLLESEHARELRAGLLGQGIALRDCGNFRGLGPHFLRVAVRGRAENQRLLAAMAALRSSGT